MNTSNYNLDAMTEEQVSKFRAYLEADASLQGHIHAGLRSAPMNNKNYARWDRRRFSELQQERDAARAEFLATNPQEMGYQESMIRAAQGHPDNPAVQAARRICEKRGFVWQ